MGKRKEIDLKFPDRDFLNRKEKLQEEPKQSAEEILEKHHEYVLTLDYIFDNIIEAMEEHRQQGRPTEEEIGYKADEHSEFIGVGGIKNNNIARQVSFMQGARWAINKWKGE